jgi:hypothetical protein
LRSAASVGRHCRKELLSKAGKQAAPFIAEMCSAALAGICGAWGVKRPSP